MCQAEPDLVLIRPVFTSLPLPRTHTHTRRVTHADLVVLRTLTVGDGAERLPASVESFQQVFGLVLSGFNSVLQPGQALCIPCTRMM